MKIKTSSWFIFLFLALLSAFIWFKFTYRQFSVVNLSVDRGTALKIAKQYLQQKGVDTTKFKTAIIFTSDFEADRYLQKFLGFSEEQKFVKKYDFDLFFWLIRFFQEDVKEEYRMTVSSKTGQVIAFSHDLEETEAKENLGEDFSKQLSIEFLEKTFGFTPEEYSLYSNTEQKFDNRTDYYFSWQRNDIYIPWSNKENTGGAKLLRSVIVSGTEINSFTKSIFYAPEEFNRFKARQMRTGDFLSSVFRIFFLVILISATYFVIARRHHLAMHVVKKFCVTVTIILLLLTVLDRLNQFEIVLFNYPTTSSLSQYISNYALSDFLSIFIATIGFLMFSLSGESLHYEAFPQKRHGAFLNYLRTTFFSREVFKMVCLGYLTFFIMLGIQSIAFKIGELNFQLWIEHNHLVRLSTNYLPFVSAFIIGFKSSIVEEVTYRVYAISWGKKLFRNTTLGIFFAAFLWGLAHSGYYIFPMWFRVFEIASLGIFLSIIYLNFGIIPVIVAHYLFDVFWNTAEYLFGQSHPIHFFSTHFILAIPFLFGLIAFFANRSISERPLQWQLTKHQLFNLKILEYYLIHHPHEFQNRTKEDVRQDLISRGWDVAVVEAAVEKV